MKCLIIEDNQAYAERLKRALTADGHVVEVYITSVFSKVTELKVVCRKIKPDVILLDHDLRWGKITGATLAEQMKWGPERLIGTSTDFDQSYCGRRFVGKDSLPRATEIKALLATIDSK